jgi:hypothetical protein
MRSFNSEDSKLLEISHEDERGLSAKPATLIASN